ncbi:hypothetical protein EAI_13738 [Harpegnathos saltator]|uniref:Myb/SANT-like DNA-binding domain-containing protein n=1 Tax=Harpegnathos saltator TaxID=610380 RepID=E2BIH2_HARSA|nr:hypothetical protein EAI_13738 [Harpegnathos saltator]
MNKYLKEVNQELLQKLIREESERRSFTIVQELTNSNDINQNLEDSEVVEPFESDAQEGAKEDYKEDSDGKETFTWPEKAIMLFLELYREREHEFTGGLKRHNKLWSETEIASELRKSNYNVSGVQVQNKMSSLKRTFKKIKDSNAKSGIIVVGHTIRLWILYLVRKAGFLLQLCK